MPGPSDITQEFYSVEEEKQLDELATHYGNLAYRAFDLWIRTLRWKADDYRMGTPELSGVKETGSRTEIREKDSPNRFWAGGHEITLFVGKPVTVEVWNKVFGSSRCWGVAAYLLRSSIQRYGSP